MVRATELVARTGLTRQWISRLASKGNIPSARRKQSGRWEFPRTPELEEWIKKEGRVTQIRLKKRYLHQDENEVRRINTKIAKIRASPNSRSNRTRLAELREELDRKKAAVKDHLTTRQLAKLVKRTPRWLTRRATSIPGFTKIGNGFGFEKSPELTNWIHRQKRIAQVEINVLPGNMKLPQDPVVSFRLESLRFERILLRAFSECPLENLPPEIAKELRKILNQLCVTIDHILR